MVLQVLNSGSKSEAVEVIGGHPIHEIRAVSTIAKSAISVVTALEVGTIYSLVVWWRGLGIVKLQPVQAEC